MKCLFVIVVFLLRVARGQDNEETQGNDWFRRGIQQIQHQKKNIEKGLLKVKHSLLKEEPQPAWKQPGARIARSVLVDTSLELRGSEIQHNNGESDEPHIGMIFQVNDVKQKEQPFDESETESSSMSMYELLEPVQLDLGVVKEHFFDYAYMPVAKRQVDSVQDQDRGDSVTVKPKSEIQPIISSLWWQWWFVVLGSDHKPQQNTRYERVGKSAFAGGSHGEVWRGRRRCDESENAKQTCDEKTPLILKRLKVEHGLAVLEAGLREVYIGNLLTRDPAAKSHFTSYVDHFFREVPRPSFLGRGLSKEHELWIVFEDAGPSLRSYLYTAVSSGEFVLHQQSSFWTALRLNAANISQTTENDKCLVPTNSWGTDPSDKPQQQHKAQRNTTTVARALMREILGQILTSAAYLHDRGVVHRDIKPSNVMCTTSFDPAKADITQLDPTEVSCLLGDFSSVWDSFTERNLYSKGPSVNEQTLEYAPPEAQPGPNWIPFEKQKPEAYDSWSIGVFTLELLLGTPNVFSVDQRTTALLTNKMQKKGASQEEIQRALYLAALSQFCIYMPTSTAVKSWPLRAGDPLFNAPMVKQSCTLQDFHHALRARDPLGTGFDSRDDTLLHLIWKLLSWDPLERITASEALQHPYFTVIDFEASNGTVPVGSHKAIEAIESLALDPRMDIRNYETVTNFTCPKCGRSFGDWRSCQMHALSRNHAKFCKYDRSSLPTCLNAHSMLPAHPTSGYCDIQGRRRTIEDFHSIQLHLTHQFYGIFDGHTGNLASKFAAATSYKELSKQLSRLDDHVEHNENWKAEVQQNLTDVFSHIHDNFLKAVSFSPVDFMDQSGTTATVIYVTDEAVVVASLGDSRAILSSRQIKDDSTAIMTAVQLTFDHVASDPDERKLVEQRGGVVTSAGGLDRVNGTLAITRSLGDARLSPLLSRNPYVLTMTRQEILEECGLSTLDGIPCFIVLASDGLWDVVSNQEAVDIVSQVVEQHDNNHGTSWEDGGAFQEAAEVLTQEAYVRGSTDNIGVCVIAID
jgi:serine/threonine protein phosphatase PrpC/serine/threonine protein kinase